MAVQDYMAKPWTTMQAMATRDFITNDIIPTCRDVENGLTADQWGEVMEELPRECHAGARVLMDLTWIVGRKAI